MLWLRRPERVPLRSLTTLRRSWGGSRWNATLLAILARPGRASLASPPHVSRPNEYQPADQNRIRSVGHSVGLEFPPTRKLGQTEPPDRPRGDDARHEFQAQDGHAVPRPRFGTYRPDRVPAPDQRAAQDWCNSEAEWQCTQRHACFAASSDALETDGPHPTAWAHYPASQLDCLASPVNQPAAHDRCAPPPEQYPASQPQRFTALRLGLEAPSARAAAPWQYPASQPECLTSSCDRCPVHNPPAPPPERQPAPKPERVTAFTLGLPAENPRAGAPRQQCPAPKSERFTASTLELATKNSRAVAPWQQRSAPKSERFTAFAFRLSAEECGKPAPEQCGTPESNRVVSSLTQPEVQVRRDAPAIR